MAIKYIISEIPDAIVCDQICIILKLSFYDFFTFVPKVMPEKLKHPKYENGTLRLQIALIKTYNEFRFQLRKNNKTITEYYMCNNSVVSLCVI
jgi:hypothetical protein